MFGSTVMATATWSAARAIGFRKGPENRLAGQLLNLIEQTFALLLGLLAQSFHPLSHGGLLFWAWRALARAMATRFCVSTQQPT